MLHESGSPIDFASTSMAQAVARNRNEELIEMFVERAILRAKDERFSQYCANMVLEYGEIREISSFNEDWGLGCCDG
jgi:uncharacterized protein YbcV (DUF1398 family)